MRIKTWKDIDWVKTEQCISRLQQRIYRAKREKNRRKLHRLQRRLLRSPEAKQLAVRRVTEKNRGRRTTGVDNVIITNNMEKLKLAKSLVLNAKVSPIKRVHIPKAGKTAKRPLGIPTIYDRACQMLVKLALEPEWEAVFEPNSYGFRPGRSCHDAIASLFLGLRSGIRYVLDADIQKCFDQIDHTKLIQKLNTFAPIEKQIKAWLKAGIMETYIKRNKKPLLPTDIGTPQGGVISPLLANIALHGLETDCKNHYAKNVWTGSTKVGQRDRLRACSVVRYADDFVVITRTESESQAMKTYIEHWLMKEAGLKLNLEKTTIRNSTKGFNFLGFHIIYLFTDKGKRPILRIHISREAKNRFLQSTRKIIQTKRSASSENLINLLNPKIVGWCNYYKYCSCVYDFKSVEYGLWGQIRAWVFRRKSKGLRSRTALKQKYFPENYEAVYNGKTHKSKWILVGSTRGRGGKSRDVHLVYPSWIKSETYIKIKGEATPFDGNHLYWTERTQKYSIMSKTQRDMLKQQKGLCMLCKRRFVTGDVWETDHIIPLIDGGKDIKENRQLVHKYCHIVKTSEEASKRSKRG